MPENILSINVSLKKTSKGFQMTSLERLSSEKPIINEIIFANKDEAILKLSEELTFIGTKLNLMAKGL